MAIINSFPNNSDEYIGAEEVMRWLHGRTSGVYGDTGNAVVSAVQNAMAVSVAKGIGWLTDADGNGIVWWSGSATQLTIDAAEPTGTLNRIDRVIVRWYIGDYSDKPELLVLKGTNASVPTPPSINTDARYKEISLARVSIPAGTTEITNMLITDERYDPSVCGIVTETVTLDTTGIYAQYEEALAELRSAIEEAWSGEISEGAVSMYYTGSIPTGWSGSAAPFTKVVTLNGIRATDHPIVDLLPSATYSDAEKQIEAWGNIYKVVASAADTLTFYATDKPDVAIPIQVRCIRK